jgi:hypothetical protein
MHKSRNRAIALAAGCLLFCGCQSWSGGALNMQNATRVPPPGTGTYQLPPGYYNNTSAATSNSQVMQASNTNSWQSAGATLPSTSLAASSQVSSSQASNPINRYTSTGPSNNVVLPNAVTSASFDQVSGGSTGAVSANWSEPAMIPTQVTPAASSIDPGFGQANAVSAEVSFSDSSAVESPNLQWQQ